MGAVNVYRLFVAYFCMKKPPCGGSFIVWGSVFVFRGHKPLGAPSVQSVQRVL